MFHAALHRNLKASANVRWGNGQCPRWPIGHLPYANALYSLFMRHPDMHRRRLVLAKPKLHFFDVDISLSITNHIYRSQEYQISKYAVA